MALGGARARVALLLWELTCRSLRRRPTAGDCVRFPLNQNQIALATGLTAVHVSRTLAHLRADRLLDYEDHTISILDPDGLQALSNVSAETMALWTDPD